VSIPALVLIALLCAFLVSVRQQWRREQKKNEQLLKENTELKLEKTTTIINHIDYFSGPRSMDEARDAAVNRVLNTPWRFGLEPDKLK
jgi:hypothetical protein